MPDTKQQKIDRMAAARPRMPIPEIPKLREDLFELTPELKREAIIDFNEKWRKFFMWG